jgi:hypothetical protein
VSPLPPSSGPASPAHPLSPPSFLLSSSLPIHHSLPSPPISPPPPPSSILYTTPLPSPLPSTQSPPSPTASLTHDWLQRRAEAVVAWQRLATETYKSATTLDHLFGDTSSYYFHAQARAPHPLPTLLRCGNLAGTQPRDRHPPPSTSPQRTAATALSTVLFATTPQTPPPACSETITPMPPPRPYFWHP